MYKKILIALIVISPLLYFFIGYPINSGKTRVYQGALVTQRCYELGNTQEFFWCFLNHRKEKGADLINMLINDVNYLQSGMGFLLILSGIIQVILILYVLRNIHENKKSI